MTKSPTIKIFEIMYVVIYVKQTLSGKIKGFYYIGIIWNNEKF